MCPAVDRQCIIFYFCFHLGKGGCSYNQPDCLTDGHCAPETDGVITMTVALIVKQENEIGYNTAKCNIDFTSDLDVDRLDYGRLAVTIIILTFIILHTQTRTRVHTQTRTRARAHTHGSTHTHTHTHTRQHTHTHTHTHTHGGTHTRTHERTHGGTNYNIGLGLKAMFQPEVGLLVPAKTYCTIWELWSCFLLVPACSSNAICLY